MDHLFLDTNILIDIFENRKPIDLNELSGYYPAYSPLSVHIYLYLYKKKVPLPEIYIFLDKLGAEAISFDLGVFKKSLEGPTNDFEDNVQLHSAAEGECDLFLTDDKGLLKMKFFGKTKIVDRLGD